jgi:hypothetical protein
MSQLDFELNMLRSRIATLEEKKRIESETASEKKAFPLKTLEDIIYEKRMKIQRNTYSKNLPLARFYDEEKVAFLEPICNIVKNIYERLEALERIK